MGQWQVNCINPLGSKGEYAIPYLAMNGISEVVSEALRIDGARSNQLIDQISGWLKVISPGIKLETAYVPYEEQAKLNVRYEGKRLDSEGFTPINAGFGIPYTVPLVLALLKSDSNSLILIENPESHLHPRGQSHIAELIARAAANGAQIFCESHSDHIINGIRVAVKKGDIRYNDVAVTYFDKNEDQETIIHPVSIDPKGSLSSYPQGLLDEWGNLMSELL